VFGIHRSFVVLTAPLDMANTLASNLTGKRVVTSGGSELGILRNITIDVRTGKIEQLHVDPEVTETDVFEQDENGYLLIPANRIRGSDNTIMVDMTENGAFSL
jgi:sporulation protein YlmC with PRC-barrel domain